MSASERTIGNYVLGPLIGRGGMSEVYAAEHRLLREPVAIKLLRSHLSSDDAAIAGFIAEATRTRAIEHPNVVRVIDFGGEAEGFFLVMERLDGETLAARILRGPVDEATARRLGAAIADGVAAAHDCGIVHRDLKPGNVVLVAGEPKIVDFGIARYFGGDAPASTGSRIGTPAYMAPEQLTGGLIAPCVDVWALGAILYEMVTGRVPFEVADGRCPQLFEPAPRLSGVSPSFAGLVAACLEREPGRRPQSLHAVARALRDPGGGDRITEDVGQLVAPAVAGAITRPVGTGRRLVAGGAALGGVAAIGLVWWLYSRPDPQPLADALDPSPSVTEPEHAIVVPQQAPLAATMAVDIRSAPDGADVSVAGKRMGVTPLTVELDGPATIMVSRRGFKPVQVWADHAGPVDVTLAPVPRASTGHPSTIRQPAGEGLD